MTDTMELELLVYTATSTNDSDSYTALISPAITTLATSKTCSLAMLVDKLLINYKGSTATKHLIRSLINRLHHNSITIAPCFNDNPENYISQMVSKAERFSNSEDHHLASISQAAKLLTSAVEAFEMHLIDFASLEYNWKEFAFHFYRSKLFGLNPVQAFAEV